MIRLIRDDQTDLFRNLAMEHALVYLANQTGEITIRIWKNEPSVILGRNQVIANEINTEYCIDNGIKIGRRISGGGSVYHDLGNLNTSFLVPIKPNKTGYSDIIEIGRHLTKIQADILWILGISDISIHNHTNILYKEKKISGSAGYYFKNWYIHHATLLLDANLNHLEKSLIIKDMDPVDKKSSKYYPTVNLNKLDQKAWLQKIGSYFAEEFRLKSVNGTYSKYELELCNELNDKLYTNEDWIMRGKRNV